MLSQVSNILFLRVWGPMADRLGSKTVLSLSSSLYLLVILGWVLTIHPERSFLNMPLLAVLHIFIGVAAAGVTLTINTLAFKVAPEGKATAFLGLASIATNMGAGVGAIFGGLMAAFFVDRSLRFDLSWMSSGEVLDLATLGASGFDFPFLIAFVAGMLSLNLLVVLREPGEVPRQIALGELASGAEPAMRAVSSVPGLGTLSTFSAAYLKRVPGADVAMGVTAYQLAASTQSAVASVSRSRVLVREVAHAVSSVLETSVHEIEDVAEHGLEFARHATRGAVHIGDHLAGDARKVTHGAVLGTLRTLAESKIAPSDALRGAGYGVVQGAIEAGENPAHAAVEAAAAASDGDSLAAVQEALSPQTELTEIDKSSDDESNEKPSPVSA